MIRAAAAAILMGVGSPAFAAGWSPPLTVASAFTENTDLIVIYTSDGATYSPGCSANAWIFYADNDARRNRAYATALMAMATGKRIQLWYGDACGAWQYHAATSIKIVN